MPTNSTPKGYRYRVMSEIFSTMSFSDGGLSQLRPCNELLLAILLPIKVDKNVRAQ